MLLSGILEDGGEDGLDGREVDVDRIWRLARYLS